jgi:hypothetical protein
MLFTQDPDRLFVFVRATIAAESGYAELPPGEPLLVDCAGRDEVSVRRWDGSRRRVERSLVTTDVPSAYVLPAKAPRPAIDDISEAMHQSGPEDDKAINAYIRTRDKYQACIDAYLEKHDPTWGTGDSVYRISGSRVTNVSEEVGRRGDKKCGACKVDKAAHEMLAKLDKTRAARWAAHLKSVRARFGL